MSTRFADLHCHPHMRAFNWLHKGGKDENNSSYHPWYIILPKFKAIEAGRRAAAYSQCDPVKLENGHVNLVFASLYPMEKGWVTGRKQFVKGGIVNLKKVFGNTLFNSLVSTCLSETLGQIGIRVGLDRRGKIAFRDLLQAIYMKLPLTRVNFFQSDKYDYFKEFGEERKFLKKKAGLKTRSAIFIPLQKRLFVNQKRIRRKHPDILDATGTYVLAKDGQDVKNIIDIEKKTAFVLTIEGANVFNSLDDTHHIISKIKEVKSWAEPVFFITYAHHFYNHLAGHAHSIPDYGKPFLDQEEGMDSGFTDKGREVIRYILSLNSSMDYKPDELGHRILIDVKHMNAISRKEFYNEIIEPCRAKNDLFPVIASHMAYSGRNTLAELIDNMPNENDFSFTERFGHKFNNWNINLCDEDVITIFKTGGVIGINLDQRVLGVSREDRHEREKHILYFWANIKGMMQAIMESSEPGLPAREKIPDLFCIGTDFDGYIDPIDKYPTSLHFKNSIKGEVWVKGLRTDLIDTINRDPDKDKFLFGLEVTKLVDKICFDNAFDFVVKWFK